MHLIPEMTELVNCRVLKLRHSIDQIEMHRYTQIIHTLKKKKDIQSKILDLKP